jgi:hypothetical protein
MSLRFLGITRRIPERIEVSPDLLNQCGAALVEASRSSDPPLQVMIDIGRIGQKIIPDSTQPPSSPAYERSRAAIKLFARSMDEDCRLFRNAMRLVETFTPRMLDLFLKQKSRAGDLITYAHVRVIMRAEKESQRTELIHYYYRYTPSVARLSARARELLGPRCSESSRHKQFDAALMRLTVAVRTMKMNLDGHTQAYLLGPLGDWADGKGTLDRHQLHMAAGAHREMVALQRKINWVVEVLGKANQVAAQQAGTAADSGDVGDVVGS